MQNTQQQLIEILKPSGSIAPMVLEEVRALVERYPYYHLARLSLVCLLYHQHDASFTDELHRSALYLPSRETLYQLVEGDSLRPEKQKSLVGLTGGATLAHKPNQRIDSQAPQFTEERTTSLIDNFLNGLPQSVVEANGLMGNNKHSVRPIDATTDYISFMLQEEEAAKQVSEQTEEKATIATETEMNVTPQPDISVEKPVTESSTDHVIDTFLQKKGDKRFQLKNRKDSELQKPVLDADNGGQKLAFTETLAHIYIKQHKFEQAIEIIRRLSLKYPEKNRYFASQIRFLEKLLMNQRAATGENV